MAPPNAVDAETRESTEPPDPVRDALMQRYRALAEEVRTLSQRIKLDQQRLSEARPALGRVRHQLTQFGYPIPETPTDQATAEATGPIPPQRSEGAQLQKDLNNLLDGATLGLWKWIRTKSTTTT